MVFIIEQLSLWLTWVWCCFESFALVLLKKKGFLIGRVGQVGQAGGSRATLGGMSGSSWRKKKNEASRRPKLRQFDHFFPFPSGGIQIKSNQIKTNSHFAIHPFNWKRERVWVSIFSVWVCECVWVCWQERKWKERGRERERESMGKKRRLWCWAIVWWNCVFVLASLRFPFASDLGLFSNKLLYSSLYRLG